MQLVFTQALDNHKSMLGASEKKMGNLRTLIKQIQTSDTQEILNDKCFEFLNAADIRRGILIKAKVSATMKSINTTIETLDDDHPAKKIVSQWRDKKERSTKTVPASANAAPPKEKVSQEESDGEALHIHQQ